MIIDTFLSFLETYYPSACVPVDLVSIARTLLIANVGPRVEHDFRFKPAKIVPSPLCLVMDGECCFDRLYGGFFGDWVCGGQWNRMVHFLKSFFQVMNKNNIELTVFFNGSLEQHRFNNWLEKQKNGKEKVVQVLKHTTYKGTPPPKCWWIAPNGLRTCLRMLLRHLKVNVILTTEDHHREVISYLRKYNYHGLLADDPEYFFSDPPRLFSAVQFKLTYKGSLETKEYILNEATRCMNLHPSRISLVAALLGNHIIAESDLEEFHHTLCPDLIGKIPPHDVIKAVINFVRNLQSVDDLDSIAEQVFGSSFKDKSDSLKLSVLYFSKDNVHSSHLPNSLEAVHYRNENIVKGSNLNLINSETLSTNRDLLHHTKFASESDENEISSLQSFQQVLGKAQQGQFDSIEQELKGTHNENLYGMEKDSDSLPQKKNDFNSEPSSPIQSPASILGHVPYEQDSSDALNIRVNTLSLSCDKTNKNLRNVDIPPLPSVSNEVKRMSRERHQKGLMHPYIHQILFQGEIKIPVSIEDDIEREVPSSLIYRPMRQMIYALLFNQHHLQFLAEQKKEKEGIEEKVPEIIIKEWVSTKSNKYNKPDLVTPLPLGWPVPTVTRLWFGSGPDDNMKRLQAFLTCMRSNTTLMSDASFIPQHYVILCCVLRYLLSTSELLFLHKHELDAFLAQAVDPHLMDTEYTQNLEVPLISSRGVLLAALFMQGVDSAIMANDACGSPIPWLMCCPWLFFDGKIFHRKLLNANVAKSLLDLCNNRYEEATAVERMRSAIIDGLDHKLLSSSSHAQRPPHLPFASFPFPHQPQLTQGRGRGHQRVVPRGGQLEVAGVVVGSWGPNYGQGPKSPGHKIPPQVVSIGRSARGRGTSSSIANKGLASTRDCRRDTNL